VLSGFILTHVYNARRSLSYWGFVRLRVARLWPTHLVTLLLVVLFVRPTSFDGEGFFDHRLTLLANLSLTQSVFPFFSRFLREFYAAERQSRRVANGTDAAYRAPHDIGAALAMLDVADLSPP
jgi:hypothetical protein